LIVIYISGHNGDSSSFHKADSETFAINGKSSSNSYFNLAITDQTNQLSSESFIFVKGETKTLKISNFEIDGSLVDLSLNDNYKVTWSLFGKRYSGSVATVTINKSGVFKGLVTVCLVSSATVWTHEFSVTVKPFESNGQSDELNNKLNSELVTANSPNISVQFVVQNKNYSTLASLDLLPWDIVLEPFKTQLITISSLMIDGNSLNITSETFANNYDINWVVFDRHYLGLSITVFVNQTGVSTGIVTIHEKSSGKSWPHEFEIAVKYIRRELRDLTAVDREKYFNALRMLYLVSEEEGQEKYGTKYHSAEYFLHKHLTGAGKFLSMLFVLLFCFNVFINIKNVNEQH
jgi:hypothetical protein